MKKIVIIFLLLTGILFSQTVQVKSVTKLLSSNAGSFYYPQFSPGDNQILLTTSNYIGIWIYDTESKDIRQLNYYKGAGYSPIFSEDGLKLIFKTDEYMGMRKYSSLIVQDVNSKKETLIEQRIRNLSTPEILSNGKIFYTRDLNQDVFSLRKMKKDQSSIQAKVAFYENSAIAIYSKEKKYLTPMGEGNYIWVSMSPQKDKLLFNYQGQGTYVSDLDGNILAELGIANAPQWSPDGKWIAYMVDEDDGHVVTNSEIYVVSSDGKKKFPITKSNDIKEMYPSWSYSGNKLIFNSTEGEIFSAELNFNKRGGKYEK